VPNNPDEVELDATPELKEISPDQYSIYQSVYGICNLVYLFAVPSPLTLEVTSDLEDDPTLVKNPGSTVRFSWNAGV
jgi:hypothetical protein